VQKPVAEAKLSQFTQGALWKSKKEKEKDAEDRKAREEEAKAAQVLAEYVDAFDSSEGPAAGARRRWTLQSAGRHGPLGTVVFVLQDGRHVQPGSGGACYSLYALQFI
jgi:hypothetical protein